MCNCNVKHMQLLCVLVCTFTDKDHLRQLMSDLVARRRAKLTAKNSDDMSDGAKNINDMIDAALALNLDEETMISDLVTFFIGGFHTSASRELSVLLIPIPFDLFHAKIDS